MIRLSFVISVLVVAAQPVLPSEDFDVAVKPFLSKYCVSCHSNGDKAKGDVDFTMASARNAIAQFEVWERAADRLRNGEMPPEGSLQPTDTESEQFLEWYSANFVESIEPHPGYFRPRRLSAAEYRNTMRSLLGFDLKVEVIEAEQTVAETSLVVKLLPRDPPGASGFRNDTHSSPLTTVLWDQYSYLADTGLAELFSPKRRTALEQITGPISESGFDKSHAQKILTSFLPRARRRPVSEEEVAEVLAWVVKSRDLQAALITELKTVLMSPAFLYRGFLSEKSPGQQVSVDQFELAERLSYFLWADMPDSELMTAAARNRLADSSDLKKQIDRMIDSTKSRSLAEDFATQWLTFDQIAKNPKRVPQALALRSQPRDFIHYLFVEDRPLIELIDSRVTFANPFTAGHYGKDRGQLGRFSKPRGVEVMAFPNKKINLVHTKSRGGILTMPGILEMNRGPIVRGTWILERILGEHLPEPPPDVGQVPAPKPGQKLSFRQRFEQHRSKSSCAVCHNRIDPLGFALEKYPGPNFDANSKADTSGQLPDGEKFEDFAGLKRLLVTTRKEQIIRNIVERTLSYALCRKLELNDRPTVNTMTEKLVQSNGTWRDLIYEIAESLPFQKTEFRE